MRCVRLLLEQGAAVILLDLDDLFMRRYSDRIDVIKNRKTCYRLYPEEYGDQLFEILGWKRRGGGAGQVQRQGGGRVVFEASGLELPGVRRWTFRFGAMKSPFCGTKTTAQPPGCGTAFWAASAGTAAHSVWTEPPAPPGSCRS